ncbi:hypothetical protein Xoosp13_264 [Xanthomonas phage Xoo-sp13]|nr:hypothetical protein Xoosp13_264 [Xanthomonas phage Xoo-sp13]
MKLNLTDIHKKTKTAPNYIMVMPVSNKSMLKLYDYDSRNKVMQVLVYGNKTDAQFGWFRDHNGHLTLSNDVNIIKQYVDL